MKKFTLMLVLIFLVALVAVGTIYAGPAKGGPAEKTTGSVGYYAGSLYRHAEFNAIATTIGCSYSWDVTGSYVIDLEYLGGIYPEHMVLTQDGTSITGDALWLVSGGSSWDITSGLVTGSVFTFDMAMGSRTAYLSGTINSDGSMQGAWGDYLPYTRTGTWESTSGFATKVPSNGCEGKGQFHYSDVNGGWYNADVRYVNVNGDEAWFGAIVTDASNSGWLGNWVFVKTHDGGEPATGVDKIWGIFTSEAATKYGVATMETPGSAYTVTEGNLQVHTN